MNFPHFLHCIYSFFSLECIMGFHKAHGYVYYERPICIFFVSKYTCSLILFFHEVFEVPLYFYCFSYVQILSILQSPNQMFFNSQNFPSQISFCYLCLFYITYHFLLGTVIYVYGSCPLVGCEYLSRKCVQ